MFGYFCSGATFRLRWRADLADSRAGHSYACRRHSPAPESLWEDTLLRKALKLAFWNRLQSLMPIRSIILKTVNVVLRGRQVSLWKLTEVVWS